MAKVKGVDKVVTALTGQTKRGKRCRYSVGYSMAYAIYVHETPPPPPKEAGQRTARHPIGQWKYLEQPARTEQAEMERIIQSALKNKRSLDEAVHRAVRHLLRVSQELVPVDTGALKASGFIRDGQGRYARE